MGIFFTAKIKKQIADLEAGIKGVRNEADLAEGERDRARAARDLALEQRNEARTDRDAAEDRNLELNNTLEEKSRNLTAEVAEHGKTKAKLAAATSEVGELNTKLEDALRDSKSKATDLTATKAQLNVLNGKLEAATTKSPSAVAANELAAIDTVLTRYKATNPVVKAITQARVAATPKTAKPAAKAAAAKRK